jgi:hypothetical protein
MKVRKMAQQKGLPPGRFRMRMVELWTYDTRNPAFRDKCIRQARLVAARDASDGQLEALMEQALDDLPPSQP